MKKYTFKLVVFIFVCVCHINGAINNKYTNMQSLPLKKEVTRLEKRVQFLEDEIGRLSGTPVKNSGVASPRQTSIDSKYTSMSTLELKRAATKLDIKTKELEDEYERLNPQGNPSGYSSPIVGTPSVSRSTSSNNFSVDGSRLLPRKIDFGEGGLNHGASDYEIVAKKSQIINALKHWIDSSLYTLGGDAGKLLQDYVDQHQPSDDSVDSVWKDVSGIEMRGSFKSRLEEIVGAVPLQKDQNPTEQKLSVIKAVCDWIDEISPGEDTKDFLKYDPLRAPAGQRIHHFPDARNPDAPTDKSKGAFKMAIRAKILEAF
jgi:hypothetical protein